MATNIYGSAGTEYPKSFHYLNELSALADVRLDGQRSWDITLHCPGATDRILANGSLGLGESYMDGDWDAPDLDDTLTRILRARLKDRINPYKLVLHSLRSRWLNLQTQARVWEVGKQHYDLGNEFYTAMLGPTMAYTCGYWRKAETLNAAQIAKLDLICRKLNLQPGQTVLDIGCGWGSFMRYAAENYGVQCVGLTISKEQAAYGKAFCNGLPVQFCLQDYRDATGQYDHVVSVGMFEHVGPRNYRVFMEVVRRCLKPGGLCLLHTIGKLRAQTPPDPWLDKYIFRNGILPTMGQIDRALEGLMVTEDVHNFGPDYDLTLMAWYANFEREWPQFRDELGDRFYRMWRFYLLSCAAAFRARTVQVWQFVLSQDGVVGGYRRPE